MRALALVLSEQDRPEDARAQLTDARRAITGALEAEAFTHETGAVLQAECVETEGWIAYRSGGDLTVAVETIKQALRMHAVAQGHVHLAQIYVERLRSDLAEPDAGRVKGDLRTACRRARELDRFGEFGRELEQLYGDVEGSARTNGEVPTPA
jgi:hypothetical protein